MNSVLYVLSFIMSYSNETLGDPFLYTLDTQNNGLMPFDDLDLALSNNPENVTDQNLFSETNDPFTLCEDYPPQTNGDSVGTNFAGDIVLQLCILQMSTMASSIDKLESKAAAFEKEIDTLRKEVERLEGETVALKDWTNQVDKLVREVQQVVEGLYSIIPQQK